MERIPERIDSKFRFVLLASRRAEQFMRGAPPRLEHSTTKKTRMAMDEIAAEAVSWDYGPAEETAAEPEEVGEELAAEPAEDVDDDE